MEYVVFSPEDWQTGEMPSFLNLNRLDQVEDLGDFTREFRQLSS